MTRSTKKRINGSKQRRKTKETPSLLIEKCQIIEKQWKATADDCKILDEQNRYVVPKKEIFTVLANCHSAIAHRGRDKTEDYMYVKKQYSGITQKVVNLFISMYTLHLQQKQVTDHQKKAITHPIQTDGFMNHVQIDLIDFRNLSCQCKEKTHTWLLHVSDHLQERKVNKWLTN